jgi:uncharacterized protein
VHRRSHWSLVLTLSLLPSAGLAATAPPSVGRVPAAVVAGPHNDTSSPFNVVSLPALIRHRYDGRGLRLGRVVSAGVTSTRYRVTYRSGDLRISGELSVPSRRGRFPLVVLAHGYKDPATYRSSETHERERTHLASRGYVVLMPDYRNYGASDRESSAPVAEPLGYPEDVVNAILAVRRAKLPFVDASRVGLLGRSMGGGVALNAAVARPGLIDAVVLSSPLSSRAGDNYRRWVLGRGARDELVRTTYGRPAENPEFWSGASARRFAHRVGVPVAVHHGTADSVCPIRWSHATVAALRQAGQTVTYYRYPGRGHGLHGVQPLVARRVADFFDRHV